MEAYTSATRLRLKYKEAYNQNSLLETFDLLHLQEMSLKIKKINRPSVLKNSEKTKLNLGRRGGK